MSNAVRSICGLVPTNPNAPAHAVQIWDADEGGAAPADLAMPGTGVGMSHTSARDFHDLVRSLSGLPPCVAQTRECGSCKSTALQTFPTRPDDGVRTPFSSYAYDHQHQLLTSIPHGSLSLRLSAVLLRQRGL